MIVRALFILTLFVSSAALADDKVYERVMDSGTLRCGYAVRAPLFMKDPNTGVFSGIFFEATEALAKILNLKVEWTEEVGWGEIVTSLNAGRFDAFCSGMWANSTRIPHMDFTKPIAYEPLNVYVRADEKRFVDVSKLNNAEVTAVGLEGATPAVVTAHDFPKAKITLLPQLTPVTDVFISLTSKKADFAVTDVASAADFEKGNPKSIKKLNDKPLRAFGVSLGVAGGEYRLKRMLDLATEEFIQTGEAESVLSRNEKAKGSFLRIPQPYERTP